MTPLYLGMGRAPATTRPDVFEGTPADLVAARSTLNGKHIAAYVGSRPEAVPAR